MKISSAIHPLFVVLMLLFLLPVTAMANEASVTLEQTGPVARGSEITITANVHHEGNNIFHHVNWLYINVNGREIARWEFGFFSLPESGNFTRQVTYTVDQPIDIKAEANCNIHGSKGPDVQRVELK